MLPRVLEPEVMDTPEEAQDYDAMDHAAVNRQFAIDFRSIWDGRGPILDVGTGTAQIPIELCGQVPGVSVVAVDLAAAMLEVGRRNVVRAGLADRVVIRQADAKALPFVGHSFAAVISNSIVHHIPEPGRVLAEMVRVLSPGGRMFVRDLLRPTDEEAVNALVEAYTAGANGHQQKMFADSLRAALTLPELRDLIVQLGMNPDEVSQTSDRHWTWSAVKPAVART